MGKLLPWSQEVRAWSRSVRHTAGRAWAAVQARIPAGWRDHRGRTILWPGQPRHRHASAGPHRTCQRHPGPRLPRFDSDRFPRNDRAPGQLRRAAQQSALRRDDGSPNTHGRSGFAWSCSCSRRHSCTAPTGSNACTSGALRRIHVLAERLQGMHDANFTGEKASQSQVHAWFVFDRDYCGPATINPVSIHRPATRMPWLRDRAIHCDQCGKRYEPRRSTSRFCSPACRQRAHHKRLSVTLSVTPSTEVFRYVRHADVPRFAAEGWELLPALDGTHHGEYSVLMRRVEQSRRNQKQDRCVTNNSG